MRRSRPVNLAGQILAVLAIHAVGGGPLVGQNPSPEAPPAAASVKPAEWMLPTSPEFRTRVERLIGQLGSDTFVEREAATKELREIGVSARSLLERATKHKDREVAQRPWRPSPPFSRRGVSVCSRSKGSDCRIKSFKEKPKGDGAWINGGFFVLEPGIFDYIQDDATVWEQAPMERLAQEGQLSAFRHQGFWQPMDTLRDKSLLEKLWQSGKAPWKLW